MNGTWEDFKAGKICTYRKVKKKKATVTEAKEQGGSVVHRRIHGTMKNPSEMEELAPESLIQGVR